MSEHQDQGSFVAGFTVGLFAGAAGYFMFGTQKGKKLRERLTDEWENARAEVGDNLPNMSWREMLSSFFDSLKDVSPEETSKAVKKTIKTVTKETKSKFKGL